MNKSFENKLIQELSAFFIGAVAAVLMVFLFLSFYSPQKKETKVQVLSSNTVSPNRGVLFNYASGVSSEVALMSSLSRLDQITLFGSSEFNDASTATYNYLPNQYGIPSVGFGHAFHQNFSIFCELLAANEYLTNSKIVLFLSPGWFETDGTNSEAFLEFVPNHFLEKIWNDVTIPAETKSEIGRYINENRANFTGLTKAMQNFQDLYFAQNTLNPEKKLKLKIGKMYPNISSSKQLNYVPNKNPLSEKEPVHSIQWMKDSLRQEFLRSCSNNKMYIDSAYFANQLQKKDGSFTLGKVNPIDISDNREYADFLLLIQLLKAKNANVSVVIQGLNPHYYSNLSVLDPLIRSIQHELTKNDIPFINLFTSDVKTYQPGTISDVMHLGDLGWLTINEFILKTYAE